MKFSSLDFFEKLQPLLASGIKLDQALAIINKNSENFVLTRIHEKIKQGSDLSSAVAEFPEFFSSIDGALIKAGEANGKIGDLLEKLIACRKHQAQIKIQIKKALFYPSLILMLSLAISFALLIFVIPQFQTVFTSFGAELPWLTQKIIFLSQTLRSYFFIFPTLLFLFSYQLKKQFRHSNFLQTIVLKTPLLGKFIHQTELGLCCYLISTTQKSGVPLLTGLELAKQASPFFYFQNKWALCQAALQAGHSLARALKDQALLDAENIALIDIGEASGTVANRLSLIAERLNNSSSTQLDYFCKLIEPLMMLFLALIAGTLIVALYLPIFNMGVALH